MPLVNMKQECPPKKSIFPFYKTECSHHFIPVTSQKLQRKKKIYFIYLTRWQRVRTQRLAAPGLWCYFCYFYIVFCAFRHTLITITVVRPYWTLVSQCNQLSRTSFIVYTAFRRRSRYQPVPRGLLTMPAGDRDGGETGSRTRDVTQAYSQDWGKTPMDHLIVCSSPMHNPWTTKWTSCNYSWTRTATSVIAVCW